MKEFRPNNDEKISYNGKTYIFPVIAEDGEKLYLEMDEETVRQIINVGLTMRASCEKGKEN